MVSRSAINLELLGTEFVISTTDARWIELVARLWEPFVCEAVTEAALSLDVTEQGSEWLMTTFSGASTINPDPWVVLHQLRNITSQHALIRSDDVIGLHGSVLSRDGFTLVLSGPAMAGKSTLMVELLARGWSYVSDDLAPIDKADGRILSFPKPINLRDASNWDRFRGRWQVPEWLPPPTETCLIPASAFSRGPERAAPSFLLFPKFDRTAAPDAAIISTAMAIAYCGQNLQNPYVELEGALPVFTRLCRGVPCGSITYASTAQALELLDDLLTAGSNH